jgi:hypothetical protein
MWNSCINFTSIVSTYIICVQNTCIQIIWKYSKRHWNKSWMQDRSREVKKMKKENVPVVWKTRWKMNVSNRAFQGNGKNWSNVEQLIHDTFNVLNNSLSCHMPCTMRCQWCNYGCIWRRILNDGIRYSQLFDSRSSMGGFYCFLVIISWKYINFTLLLPFCTSIIRESNTINQTNVTTTYA